VSYADFLAAKQREHGTYGLPHATAEFVSEHLSPWQREGVAWAARKGRAALWWTTGLGKTRAQLEWARLMDGRGMTDRGSKRALIVAPLAVCEQTVREGMKIGVEAHYVRSGDAVPDTGLLVTNYEMMEHFDPAMLCAVVLDEASILKQSDGKTRTRLISHFSSVPARLACTATPAPNDMEELTNQAEFLGVMPRVEMLAAYFVHDQNGWRLKRHAVGPMYRWMTSWAMALRSPSDIGYPDDGYILPPLNIITDLVHVDLEVPDGQLFATDLGGVGGRAKVRRESLDARVQRAVELVKAEPDEPWLLWTGLNDEAAALAAALPGAVNVQGSWAPEEKADAYLRFADGDIRYLVTKPSMAAMGLNFQHCARQIFVGMSDSWEMWFQAIRRSWRYGQTRPVDVHAVLSHLESQIAENVRRKGEQADRMVDAMVAAMRQSWSINR
jgi:hypothetical protein